MTAVISSMTINSNEYLRCHKVSFLLSTLSQHNK